MNNSSSQVVYIVDDDEAIRDSLKWLISSEPYQIKTFASAEHFLDCFDKNDIACVFLDIRMNMMSGLELFDKLIAHGITVPVTFITGHGDVAMAVSAIQKGAFDFLTKPFTEESVRKALTKMLEAAQKQHDQELENLQIEALLSKLTHREQQVLDLIVDGHLNKQIADKLNISIKTVEAHRANIMEKLNVTHISGLMKISMRAKQIQSHNH